MNQINIKVLQFSILKNQLPKHCFVLELQFCFLVPRSSEQKNMLHSNSRPKTCRESHATRIFTAECSHVHQTLTMRNINPH